MKLNTSILMLGFLAGMAAIGIAKTPETIVRNGIP